MQWITSRLKREDDEHAVPFVVRNTGCSKALAREFIASVPAAA